MGVIFMESTRFCGISQFYHSTAFIVMTQGTVLQLFYKGAQSINIILCHHLLFSTLMCVCLEMSLSWMPLIVSNTLIIDTQSFTALLCSLNFDVLLYAFLVSENIWTLNLILYEGGLDYDFTWILQNQLSIVDWISTCIGEELISSAKEWLTLHWWRGSPAFEKCTFNPYFLVWIRFFNTSWNFESGFSILLETDTINNMMFFFFWTNRLDLTRLKYELTLFDYGSTQLTL